MLARIEGIHRLSGYTYGSPRVHRALCRAGIRTGAKRVARLMREHQLKSRSARIYVANPGAHAFFQSIPNRSLGVVVSGPDQVWRGDLTYLKVGQQWRYLATVLDQYSRRIIGWCLGKNKTTKLTLTALNRAVAARRPGQGVIFHSDRGIEYAANVYRERIHELGFVQSMNRPGKLTDNAPMESFFHSMKSDAYHGFYFTRERDLRDQLKKYMSFYNEERLHSSLGYRSPVEFELGLVG